MKHLLNVLKVIFRNGVYGSVEKYDGARKSEAIVDWVLLKLNPARNQVTCNSLKGIVEKEDNKK
jgi:hypothetical protein